VNWLDLPEEEQLNLLEAVAAEQRRLPVILEKDIWVVWVLGEVFRPGLIGPALAFKGGTSLSKAYGAIRRFSEDLDLTLDLLSMPGWTVAELGQLGRNARDRAIASIKAEAERMVFQELQPKLQQAAETFDPRLQVAQVGKRTDLQLELQYPTVLPTGNRYIQRRVLLEFGGRNAVSPHVRKTIRTYLAEDPRVAQHLTLPEAQVDVLDARRTFWEKLTAVHVACRRPDRLDRLRGFSRHLLDLHLLMQSDIGPAALVSSELRDEVIDLKSLLFREGSVQYSDCREERADLVPAGDVLLALREDYREMEASGMFGDEHVPFTAVLATLEEIEARLNGRGVL